MRLVAEGFVLLIKDLEILIYRARLRHCIYTTIYDNVCNVEFILSPLIDSCWSMLSLRKFDQFAVVNKRRLKKQGVVLQIKKQEGSSRQMESAIACGV